MRPAATRCRGLELAAEYGICAAEPNGRVLVQLSDPAVAGSPPQATARPPLLPWLLPAVAFVLPLLLAFASKGTVLLLGLLAVGGAVENLRQRRLALPPRPILVALALALAWGAASTVWQVIPGLALSKAAQLLGVTALGLLAWGGGAYLSPQQRRRMLAALAAGLVVAGLVMVEERLTNLKLRQLLAAAQGNHLEVRPWVEMWMYKTAAALSGVLAVPALGAAWRRRRWLVAAAVAAAVLTMAAMTGSLAGSLAFALGLALLLIGRRAALLLLSVAVAGGFVLAPFAAQLPRTEEISRHLTLPNSALHRTIIWRFAASHVPEHPLLGWGLDAARELPGNDGMEVLTPAHGPSFAQPVLPLHPHNLFVQVWLELGAIGALLVGGLLLAVARSAARTSAEAVAAMGAAVVISAASFGAWQSWWLAVVWMLAAMLAAADDA